MELREQGEGNVFQVRLRAGMSERSCSRDDDCSLCDLGIVHRLMNENGYVCEDM